MTNDEDNLKPPAETIRTRGELTEDDAEMPDIFSTYSTDGAVNGMCLKFYKILSFVWYKCLNLSAVNFACNLFSS